MTRRVFCSSLKRLKEICINVFVFVVGKFYSYCFSRGFKGLRKVRLVRSSQVLGVMEGIWNKYSQRGMCARSKCLVREKYVCLRLVDLEKSCHRVELEFVVLGYSGPNDC